MNITASRLTLAAFVLASAVIPSARAGTIFDNTSASNDDYWFCSDGSPCGQAFTTGTAGETVTGVALHLFRVATPSAINVDLYSDSGSSLLGTRIGQLGTILPVSVPTSTDALVSVTLTGNSLLAPNTRYWIVLTAVDGEVNWDSTYQLSDADLFYTNGSDITYSAENYIMSVVGTEASPTPEPATFAGCLVAAGMAAVFGRRRFNSAR